MQYDDIPDVMDDDLIDGEEQLLENLAAARRVGKGQLAVFPITVTGGGGGGGDGGAAAGHGDGSSPSSYGMTLAHYMSRMVTTPASAAATSGECFAVRQGWLHRLVAVII